MKKVLSIVALMAIGSFSYADGLGEGKTALEYHDYTKAAEAFTRSCDGGSAEGCFYLGSLYEKGEGVAQNKYRASTLYAQACRSGEPLGCSHMGLGTDTP